MGTPTDHGRRAFLGMRSRSAPDPAAIRPPWTSASSLTENCTHCGDCIAACPEHILILDRTGTPEVDFNRGGCTFCGDCAASCSVPVFDRALSPAWNIRAEISQACLPKRGILCESCADVCADRAIRFLRTAGRAPVPAIALDSCTGCGACISICPASAIGITRVSGAAVDA